MRPPHAIALTIALFIAAALTFRLTRGNAAYWNVDDVSIGYTYAQSFAHGTTSVFPEGPRVEGHSTPFFCFALAALYFLRLFDPITTHIVLESLLFAAAVVCLFAALRRRAGCLPALTGASAFVATELMTPSTWIWYGSGIEAVWMTAALMALIWRADAILNGESRPWLDTFVAVVMLLMRPEGFLHAGAVFAGVGALLFVRRKTPEHAGGHIPFAKTLFATALAGAAFLAWRWWLYQNLLPNTYYAKAHNFGFLAYFNSYVVPLIFNYHHTLAFVAATVCLFFLRGWRDIATAVFLLLVASIALPGSKGSDWMGEHRFATPLFAMAHAGFALFVTAALSIPVRSQRAAATALVTGFLLMFAREGIPAVRGARLHEITTGFVAHIQGALRIDHQRRLGVPNPTVILPDAGGALLVGSFRLLDSGYLTDYQLARLKDKTALFNQYEHQEQAAHMAGNSLLAFWAFDPALVGPLFAGQPGTPGFARKDLVVVSDPPPESTLLAQVPGVRVFSSDRNVPVAGPGGIVRMEIIVQRDSALAAGAARLRAQLGNDWDEIHLAPYGNDPGPGIERRAFLLGAPAAAGTFKASMVFTAGGWNDDAYPLGEIEVVAETARRCAIADALVATPGRAAREQARMLAQLREQSIPRLSHQEWLGTAEALRHADALNERSQADHLRKIVWDARLAGSEHTTPELDATMSRVVDKVIADARCTPMPPAARLLCLGKAVRDLRALGVFAVAGRPGVRVPAENALKALENTNRSPLDTYLSLVGRSLLWPDDMAVQKHLLAARAAISPLPALAP